jgi:hypothetical protein
MLVILVDVKWFLPVVWADVSLIMNDVELFIGYFLAIYKSSL